MLLQVLLDDLQVHLRAGGGGRCAPSPPTCAKPDLSHISHLTNKEQDTGFQKYDFERESLLHDADGEKTLCMMGGINLGSVITCVIIRSNTCCVVILHETPIVVLLWCTFARE